MASLGGQGAKGFAKGLTQGYGAVDSALTNKQNRDIQGFKQDRAEEIYALAKQKEQQIAKVNQVASATETNTKTQQTVDVLAANQKASNANQMSVATNNVVSSSDPEQKKESIANANTLVKNNPSLMKTLGLGPNDTIEDLDLKLPKDNVEFTRNLGGLGITPESMGYDLEDPEDLKTWNEFKGEMQPLLSMVKVGENYIDAEALGRGMKTPSRASAQEKKDLAKTQMKQKTAVKKAQNTQVDKQIASTKAKADAAGIYFNPEVLAGSSVEEKQEIIDGVNKSIRQSATKDPMAGTETTQLDYKGGNQGMPTTEAMVNGEMVNVGDDGVVVDKSGKPIVTKNADGSKVTYKQGEVKGTTETTTVAPDGTKTVKTTEDQSLLKPETAKATENVEVVEASIQTQASRGTPASDEYMRHLYALAGKTYPIPDDTAKMKNYKFMTANGATDEQARKAIFPATKALTVTAKVQEYEALVKSGIPPKDAVKTVWKHDKPATIASKVQEYNELKKTMSSTEAAKVVWGKEGKPPAAKVQEINNLVTKGKTIDEALDMVYGSDKNITADQIIADWRKVNPDATEDELLKFSAAVRGKYEPAGKAKTKEELGQERRTATIKFNRDNKFDDKATYVPNSAIDKALDNPTKLISDSRADATRAARKDINALSSTMQKMSTFSKMVEKDTYKRDLVQKAKDKYYSITADQFGNMTKAQQNAHIDKVFTNSYGGQILADYMKSISGTAIADAEYQRLLKIFEGDAWSDKTTYQAAIEGFATGIEDTVENKAMSIQTDNPVESLMIRRQVQQARAARWENGDAVPNGYQVVHDGKGGYMVEEKVS